MRQVLGWCVLVAFLLNVLALARRIYPMSQFFTIGVTTVLVAGIVSLGVLHLRRPLSLRASLMVLLFTIVVMYVGRSF